MTESIEVYFKNENDAKSAEAELRTLKLKKIYTEEMADELDTELFVPFISSSVDSRGITTGGAGSATSLFTDKKGDSPGPNYPSYLLHVEVETDDWDKAIDILEKHNCYRNKDK